MSSSFQELVSTSRPAIWWIAASLAFLKGASGSSSPRSDLLQRTIASRVSSESWVMISPFEVFPILCPLLPTLWMSLETCLGELYWIT